MICSGCIGSFSPLFSCSGKSVRIGCTSGCNVGAASAFIGTVLTICHSSNFCDAKMVPIIVFLYLQQITNIAIQHRAPITAEIICICCHHSVSDINVRKFHCAIKNSSLLLYICSLVSLVTSCNICIKSTSTTAVPELYTFGSLFLAVGYHCRSGKLY